MSSPQVLVMIRNLKITGLIFLKHLTTATYVPSLEYVRECIFQMYISDIVNIFPHASFFLPNLFLSLSLLVTLGEKNSLFPSTLIAT